MFGLFFSERLPQNYEEMTRLCDTQKFAQFFHAMLDGGVYLAPSAFEAGFMSQAHSDDDLDKTIAVADGVFATLGKA